MGQSISVQIFFQSKLLGALNLMNEQVLKKIFRFFSNISNNLERFSQCILHKYKNFFLLSKQSFK